MAEKRPLGCTVWALSWVATIWIGAQIFAAFTGEQPTAETAAVVPTATATTKQVPVRIDAEERAGLVATARMTQLPGAPHGRLLRGASVGRFAGELAQLGFAFRVTPIPGDIGQAIGEHPDGSWIQLKGNGDAVASAAFMFTVAPNDNDGSVRTAQAIAVFMRETGWESGFEWVMSAIKNSGGKKISRGVLYEVGSPVAGVFAIEAKPAPAAVAPAARKKEPEPEREPFVTRPFAGNVQ